MRRSVNVVKVLLFVVLWPGAAAACDCDTVYFLVSDKWGTRADTTSYSSYVLPLSDEQDKADARTLIEQVRQYRNTPEDPFPDEPGSIVLAGIFWGADGMNRNHFVPGKPEWWWHVSEFAGFTPATVEIADGSPEVAHLYHFRDGYGSTGAIGFWDYTITAELGPALCLHVTPEAERLRFEWTNLSTNAAYPGTNYVYTVEMKDSLTGEWTPVPGGDWPTRETEWLWPGGEESAEEYYRIRPERLDAESAGPVSRDRETVFFQVSRASITAGIVHLTDRSSFVVPLSRVEDKTHARNLIRHFKESPDEPLPDDPGAGVMVDVDWAGDGVNRNYLVPGSPLWPWHVTEFLGFTPFTGEKDIPMDGRTGWPEGVNPSIETIHGEGYLITDELGPALSLSVSPGAGGLGFQWTDLSTNAAYPGTNWVYTVETRQMNSENWVPAPDGDWPTRETEWIQTSEEGVPARFYRLAAEAPEE